MFKKLLIAFSLIFALGIVWAQGLETFENHPLSGTNYFDGDYVGDNGITWNYVHCSGQQSYPIDDKGLLLRSLARQSEVYSNSIPGGIGDFSVQMRKAFTGTGDRQVALYVNGDWIADSQTFGGTSGADDTIHTFTVNNVNIPGDVVISIKSTTGTGTNYRQLVIDNLSWTAYEGDPPPPTPTISVVSDLSAFSTEVGSPSQYQIYNLSGSNLTQNINVMAPEGFELSSDDSSYSGILSLAPDFDGSVYVRLIGDELGEYSGDITHNSDGAAERTVAVSGLVYEPAEPEDPVLLLEENFEYEVGTTLAENGWTAHSGAGDNSPTVADINLSYPNYPPSSGKAGQTLGNGEDVNRAFLPQTSGDVYTSFLINVTDAKTGNGDYVYHFMSGSSDFKAKFFVSKDANDKIRFGLTKQSNAGVNVDYTGYDYDLETTYLVVLKYEFVPGTLNDIVTGWINPVIGPNEPAPTMSPIINEYDIGAAGIGSIAIRQSRDTPIAIFDGIRVSNDWALLWSDETPEPRFIHVSGEIDPLYNIAGTPSEEIDFYELSGENLVGPITITAPEGFEVSDDEEQGWDNLIQVPATFDDNIYVRIVSDVVGEHGGNIVHSSPGADPVSIRVEGETFPPDAVINIDADLEDFEQTIGNPSMHQVYYLSATGANSDITVEVNDPFELSTSALGTWTTELTLAHDFDGPVYVRLNADVVGQYQGVIVHETLLASTEYLYLTGLAIPPAGDQYATDLFFSEYIEGSSNNKAIEIFNGTGAPVDLANYKVNLYANGATTPNNTQIFEPGTTLHHGNVYVLVNSQADAAILALKDITSTVANFNGDDALALVKIVGEDEEYVDIFGRIGERPANPAAWVDGDHSTLDKTLVRKSTITGGVTVNPDEGFPTLAAEWDVYPIDTNTNLGSHVFTPVEDVVAMPEISPASGMYYSPVNVSISCDTDGADIYYTTDGSDPIQNGVFYAGFFSVSQNTTVKAYATAEGMIPSSVAKRVYSFPIDVQNIAELRGMPTGENNVYRLVGEAVLTYQNDNRNTKYIQDATAAIVIDDYDGVIETTYNLYDGITGVTGYINKYAELLQFVPKADPGVATSSNNVVVPEVRTLASITSADQAKLIKVINAEVVNPSGNYLATAQNIDVTDPSGSAVMRTFYNTDYAETPVHDYPVNITCLVGQYYDDMQISPRFLSDFEAYAGGLDAPVVTITKDGNNIKLSWNAVDGATAYDIYGSNDPYPPYPEAGHHFVLVEENWTGTEWTHAPADMKFYYVKAKN